jgi:hypothetical protein
MYRGIQQGYSTSSFLTLRHLESFFKRWVSYIVSLDFIDNVDSAIGGRSLQDEELDVDEFTLVALWLNASDIFQNPE